MKSIKLFGLAVLGLLISMVFVSVSPAVGAKALCSQDESPCESENEVKHLHPTTNTWWAKILNSISNVKCQLLLLVQSLRHAETGGGDNVFLEHSKRTYTECIDSKPNSCTVEAVGEEALIEISTEGAGKEEGSVAFEGETKVVCSGISCVYNGKELLGTASGPLKSTETNGEITIPEQTLNKVKGLLCPSTAKLDLTITPLSAVYIS